MGFGPNIEVTISTGVGFLSRTSERHPGRRGWLCVFLVFGLFSGYTHLKAAQDREVMSICLSAALEHGNEATPELGSRACAAPWLYH